MSAIFGIDPAGAPSDATAFAFSPCNSLTAQAVREAVGRALDKYRPPHGSPADPHVAAPGATHCDGCGGEIASLREPCLRLRPSADTVWAELIAEMERQS